MALTGKQILNGPKKTLIKSSLKILHDETVGLRSVKTFSLPVFGKVCPQLHDVHAEPFLCFRKMLCDQAAEWFGYGLERCAKEKQ